MYFTNAIARCFLTVKCFWKAERTSRAWRTLSVSALSVGFCISVMGCPLITHEVPCRARRDCPVGFLKCDLEGVADGGIGFCTSGTAPTGIPQPDEALIDFPDGGAFGGPEAGGPGGPG